MITPLVMRPQATPPRPLPNRSVPARRNVLLAAIHTRRGVWTTGRARDFYRTTIPTHVYETNVRRDLVALWAAGHLDRHGQDGRVSYTLRTKGGTA